MDWEETKQRVTEAMCAHTLRCTTPLTTPTMMDVPVLEGSGNYVVWSEGRPIVLTCEHVARTQPIDYRFAGSTDVFRHPGPWSSERFPIDASYATLSRSQWEATNHESECVGKARFAQRHSMVDPAELLFLRGYAGENAHYFEVHQANASCYCSQEKANSGDDTHFDLIWEPEHTQVTDGTSAEARADVRFEDPQGISGALVWNTRYLEATRSGREWTPNDAVVTGMAHRWDQKAQTLVVLRVEHLRRWLDSRGA